MIYNQNNANEIYHKMGFEARYSQNEMLTLQNVIKTQKVFEQDNITFKIFAHITIKYLYCVYISHIDSKIVSNLYTLHSNYRITGILKELPKQKAKTLHDQVLHFHCKLPHFSRDQVLLAFIDISHITDTSE